MVVGSGASGGDRSEALNDPFLGALAAVVGEGGLLVDAADTQAYEHDWRGRFPGRARAVARPGTTEQVAEVVRLCAREHVGIVPQGGNTGLVGGSTPDASGREIVLSLRRMNRVREVDAVDNTMTLEAGVLLVEAQQAAAAHDRLFPLALAAEGSATIGGNLATNAGGEQVVRYGNARALALGLEVVLADGRVLHALSPLRKDNTGYDLRDLFVGSEGTLGVITAATLALFPRPRQQVTAWIGLETPRAAVELLSALRAGMGERVSAFELISREALEQVLRHIDGARDPLPQPWPWAVLAEFGETLETANLQGAVEAQLGAAIEQGLAGDATLAASGAQADALWHLRDHVPEAQTREGASIKHDISVRVSRIPEFIERTGAALLARFPGVRLVTFGHVGDGNLHYNLSVARGGDPKSFLAQEERMHEVVYAQVLDLGGSISAEHGIGRLKQADFLRYKDPVAVDAMRALKRALDPHNLFNPGRLIPAP
jgi:FAD/FMN-containing dehydrogenase